MERAIFGMGCFWQPDEYFSNLEGIESVRAGYSGGTKKSPTYTDLGDHTETVEILFDPNKITYQDLLAHFWRQHDPTSEQKTQYKSAIFYRNDAQQHEAEESKAAWTKKYTRPVLTEILPATEFYEAEGYHQKYLRKCGLAKPA